MTGNELSYELIARLDEILKSFADIFYRIDSRRSGYAETKGA